MRIAIVGFAGAGKSTLFELATGVRADPAAVGTGQVAVAQVPDPRLSALARLYEPGKVTAAAVEFMDTPPLDPAGGKENARVLALARHSDALLIVLGQFLGGVPGQEFERLAGELVLADLAMVSGRIERVEASLKKPRPADQREALTAELEALHRFADEAESQGLHTQLTAAQTKLFQGYQLFVQKPRFVVVNLAEDQLGADPAAFGLPPDADYLALAARLELELLQLSEEERSEFMSELGIDQLSRDRLLTRLMGGPIGQITFFTVNAKELRAWLLPAGATAVQAAGRVHTDLARGFIRAEVVHYDDLVQCGSEREAKQRGLYHLEGKDYQVQDGDVILFRFNV